MLPLLLLMLLLTDGGLAQRVTGVKKNGSCVCEVNAAVWSFPIEKYDVAAKGVQTCDESLQKLHEQVTLSVERLPQILDLVGNITDRLEPYQYLHYKGIYTDLSLRRLAQELRELEGDVSAMHSQMNTPQTEKLSKEVIKLRGDVDKITVSDTLNMKSVKEKMRHLKNRAESCKSIPQDFRGDGRYCIKGLMKNISSPVVAKVSPYGKSIISGSWGKQSYLESDEQKNVVWVQPLTNSHYWGNILRVYNDDEEFMSSTNPKDYTFAPSNTHSNAIEGPSGVLYGEAFYYRCYRTAEVCRYDMKTNVVKRVKLPGDDVGYNNKFPYCYYDCRPNSDIDIEADETGLWAIYATVSNHGNIVVSRLIWDNEWETINVTQTWETRLFKKAATNAFMACGVLYATRYVDLYREEVFYAFNTATGRDDNSLALPLEKVAKGVASLSYNPNNRQLYMYNDGYLLSYEAKF